MVYFLLICTIYETISRTRSRIIKINWEKIYFVENLTFIYLDEFAKLRTIANDLMRHKLMSKRSLRTIECIEWSLGVFRIYCEVFQIAIDDPSCRDRSRYWKKTTRDGFSQCYIIWWYDRIIYRGTDNFWDHLPVRRAFMWFLAAHGTFCYCLRIRFFFFIVRQIAIIVLYT